MLMNNKDVEREVDAMGENYVDVWDLSKWELGGKMCISSMDVIMDPSIELLAGFLSVSLHPGPSSRHPFSSC